MAHFGGQGWVPKSAGGRRVLAVVVGVGFVVVAGFLIWIGTQA